MVGRSPRDRRSRTEELGSPQGFPFLLTQKMPVEAAIASLDYGADEIHRCKLYVMGLR